MKPLIISKPRKGKPIMKNKNMKQNTFAGMTILAGMGMLLLANEIAAQEGQEEIRRSLRGTTLSTPPPPGVDPTGIDPLDPTRAEGGRPSEILVPGGGLEVVPGGGIEEEVPNTDVNELTMPPADPFLEEPTTVLNELTVPGGGIEEEAPNTDVNELTMPPADPFMEEVPNPDLNELTVPGGGIEEEVPNTDVNELTVPSAPPGG
jgi:hypothetical protein